MKLAIIPGDGVGPELSSEINKLVHIIDNYYKKRIESKIYPFGGAHFIRYGEALSKDFIQELKNHYRGVIVMALGDPAVYSRAYINDILSGIIHTMELSIVEKPIMLFSPDLSRLRTMSEAAMQLLVIRDSIEGLEVRGGFRVRRNSRREIATDTHIYEEEDVRRVINYAVKRAREEKVQLLPLVLRRPLFPNTHALWEKAYKDIMQKNEMNAVILELPVFLQRFIREPQGLSMILAPGFTGEMISELLTEFVGGKSFSTSIFCNDEGKFMILPEQGPQNAIVGKNRVLPFSAFFSLAMTYRMFKRMTPAKLILKSIVKSFENKWLTPELDGSLGSDTIGDFVAAYIDEQLNKLPESSR